MISMIDIQALNADPFKRDQFSIEVLALVGQVGPSPIHVQEKPSVPTAQGQLPLLIRICHNHRLGWPMEFSPGC